MNFKLRNDIKNTKYNPEERALKFEPRMRFELTTYTRSLSAFG